MKYADWFSIFVLIVFVLVLIFIGGLCFLLGDILPLAACGLLAGSGLCVGFGVGYCISGRIKEAVGGKPPLEDQ